MAGGCERCTGSGLCSPTTCNFDCRHVTETECETLVMGGLMRLGDDKYNELLSSCLPCYRIDRLDTLLKQANLKVGDLITHVNGIFPEGIEHFSSLMLSLKKGDVLKVYKGNDRMDVTL